MLELELLHQWTTVTYVTVFLLVSRPTLTHGCRYKSYCVNVVSEYHNWQVVVPQLALKHECLLHGMLAMSALEIAAFTTNNNQRVDYYVNVALEYQNLSTSELRRQLCNVTSENRRALFALSSILMVLGLAIPRFVLQRGERGNMLDYVMTYVALLKGLKTIADTTENFIEEEQLLADWPTWDALPAPDLEPDIQCVFETLATSIDETSWQKNLQDSYRSVYKQALGYLEENFSKCRGPVTRAYCLGWPLQAGDEYLAALMDRQPLALVFMMIWGVLLDEVCQDIWWAAGVGHQLVQDLSRLISTDDSKINAGVIWAQSRVAMVPELDLG